MRVTRNRIQCARRAATAPMVYGFCLLIPLVSNAAPWDYGVNVDLGIIYTDNLLLADEGMEESEVVYTVAPEIFLTTDGDRLDVNLLYRPEALFYSDHSDANGVFHVVDARLTGEIVRDRFFLDLSAVNYQSIITPEGRIPTSNLPITGNRIDSRTLEARPYWQQRLGQANLLVEASYRDVEYDSDLAQSISQYNGQFNLDNFDRQEGLAWGINYRYTRTEYESPRPWAYEQAALNLGYWFTGSLRIFGVVGAETGFDNLFESNLDEDFWEAGFQYRPDQRLNLEIAAGDRSYGNSLRGEFTYKLRRGEIALTYDEGPATRGEQGFGYRPLVDTDNLDNTFNQPARSDRFLRKRGDFRATVDLSKSNLTLRIFAEERKFRTTAGGIELSDEDVSGAALRWSWELGRKTTLGVDFDVTKRDRSGITDELRRSNIDLNYNLSQRLDIILALMRSEHKSTSQNAFNYVENQIRLMLSASF